MVANFEMESDSDIQYLGPDLLGTYILNNMDIRISNYYQWLYTTKEQIDTLFNNVDSRYKLSTFVKGEIVKPDVKGVNQYLGYCLLGVIGIVWIGIGIYFLKNYVLRKR